MGSHSGTGGMAAGKRRCCRDGSITDVGFACRHLHTVLSQECPQPGRRMWAQGAAA